MQDSTFETTKYAPPLRSEIKIGNTTFVVNSFFQKEAKESVVSTLSVLFGSTASLQAALSPLAAASLLVFCLLYTPCVAAVASIKQELGGKWALGIVIWQCAVAWIVAMIVRIIGLAVGFV